MSLSTLIPTPALQNRPRDVQTVQITDNTWVSRSRTWDRLKFEVEYARQRGTTANSYLIRGDRTAIIDPPGESFTEIYLAEIERYIDLEQLDYIILGHVNANRIATLKALLPKAPRITLLCSKSAVNTLKNAFPYRKIQGIRSDEPLDLGQGHVLDFIPVPTPRWPDGLCCYDRRTRVLYSDKFFSVHVCSDLFWDENWKELDDDRRYFFDCLHASQSKQVEIALDKVKEFPARYYAPAHGPIVRYSLSRLTYDYRYWCQEQKTRPLRVTLLYASAYGNTATMAGAIERGLLDHDVAVESMNCEFTDPAEIARSIEACDGFIIGSPTLGGHAPTQIQTALGIVLSTAAKTKLAGVFGSYGWSGEAIDQIETKLKDANYQLGFESIAARFSPTEKILAELYEIGAEFARTLKKARKTRVPRQTLTDGALDRTARAAARVIGSLCVLTTKPGDRSTAFLTSWVSQASFNPPGIMIAIAGEQSADHLIQPGATFVLNILKEGRNLRRHFTTVANTGEDPFVGLETRVADNGNTILTQSLAYLECTVKERLQCGDRWLLYATIERGEVLDTNGITAIDR
ncbi:diflavin flavoprotein [Pannus brasiliensis CCIBt3594]|uniref:Diflavin flavoprotein n=1 Tax=Pannus brasiliensis CCIBt3594 TaxID=1427578 RepID=A0AAW9QYC9_9CHRO